MPINYKDYHPQWKQISKGIIENRAGNKCELCGAPNGKDVVRPIKGFEGNYKYPWRTYQYYKPAEERKTKIILTVHHIDNNKENNADLNLIALCQHCHLRLDLAKHINNRRNRHTKNNENLFMKG